MPHTLNKAHWPLVHGVFSGSITTEDLRDHQAQLEAFHASKKRYGLIVDLRAVTETPPNVRAFQADWLKNNRLSLKEWTTGIAFAVNSPVIQGVMTALFWVSPPMFNHKVSRDINTITNWTFERMTDAQLSGVPDKSIILKLLSSTGSKAA